MTPERGSSSAGRFRGALAGAAVLLLAATGCSAPGPGKSASGTATTASAATASPTPRTTRTAPATPAGKVAFPWQPGRPQLGIQVFWGDTPKDSDSTIRLKAERMISYVTSLDANSITISFPFHTSGPEASEVNSGSDTPSPARLDITVRLAEAAGLRVTLRPLMDETSLVAAGPNNWRGNIEPADRSAWFASYQDFLTPYLELAQRDRVQTFVIGTEFSSMQNDPRWSGVISAARADYQGQLTYADNWDSYVEQSASMPVDQVGVDAYPDLTDLGDNATVPQIVAGWNAWLDQKTTGPLPDSLFYEVDAPAEQGAYQHPGSWENAGPTLDLTVQANWFKAVCQVAQSRDLAGLYWWRVDMQQDPAAADPQHDRTDSWVGRPAADIIRSCFSGWAAATG